MIYNQSVILKNGIKMPILGFGVYKIQDGDEGAQIIRNAVETGYRHIDTAAYYGNEKSVAEGIKRSGLPRGEIFITSKVWNDDHGYDKTMRAFESTLKNLNTDYLDLYLIHWPSGRNGETWHALEQIYRDKRAKAIGVSNFNPEHIEQILEDAEFVPMVNQIEFHPLLQQSKVREYCKARDITVEAWSPLMRGRLSENPLLLELAKKHGKTVSQIILRWEIQQSVVTIPKTVRIERMRENADIFNFKLSADEMKRIAGLNENVRTGPDPVDMAG